MASRDDQSYPDDASCRVTHRVALELEVDDRPDSIDPADWELRDLTYALLTGSARAVRTIRGLVVDPENDRLSQTLRAMADDLDEATQLQWMASAARWHMFNRVLRAPRPSLTVLVGLEQLVLMARDLACQLEQRGL
jgi:hypothetical protein